MDWILRLVIYFWTCFFDLAHGKGSNALISVGASPILSCLVLLSGCRVVAGFFGV